MRAEEIPYDRLREYTGESLYFRTEEMIYKARLISVCDEYIAIAGYESVPAVITRGELVGAFVKTEGISSAPCDLHYIDVMP